MVHNCHVGVVETPALRGQPWPQPILLRDLEPGKDKSLTSSRVTCEGSQRLMAAGLYCTKTPAMAGVGHGLPSRA